MIKLIIGNKGTGKTKILIDMINKSLQTTNGNVVCLDKTQKLRFDVSSSVRLIDVETYNINGHDMFYGLLSGVLAGNYDITEIYVDSIFKIVGRDYEKFGDMLDKINEITEKNKINVILTVSCDKEDLPESVLKYS